MGEIAPVPVVSSGIGEAWLLAYSPSSQIADGERGILYRLRAFHRDARTGSHFEIVRHARAALGRIGRQARRDLPFAIDPSLLLAPEPSWEADHVAGDDARSIDGTSVGVPAYLCAASLFLGIPVPEGVIATGTVEPDGAITPVAGVRDKTRVAAKHLGDKLRMVIVPPRTIGLDNEADARGALAAKGLSEAKVLSTRHVSELLDLVFERRNLEHTLQQHLGDAAWRARIVEALFRMTVRGDSRVLQWSPIATIASAARDASSDPEEREKAAIAAAIAERHSGHSSHRIAVRPGLPLPLQLELQAHRVQAVADDPGAQDWRHEVDSAIAILGERALRTEELKLAGAVGRALAAWGELEKALSWLTRACRGWEMVIQPESSSYALCERLRVAALLDSWKDLEEALSFAQRHLGLFSDVAAFSVRLAAARALVDAGRLDLVETWLGEPGDWAYAPLFLEEAWRRVRARACWLRGDQEGAEKLWGACKGIEARLERAAFGTGTDIEIDGLMATEPASSARAEFARLRDLASRRGTDLHWSIRALRY